MNQARKLNHETKFCSLDPGVRIGAEIIGLDKVVEIRDTEHDALRAFPAQAAGATQDILRSHDRAGFRFCLSLRAPAPRLTLGECSCSWP